MANSFFKHNDKVYSENLNDSVLIGNSFSLIVDIGLPGDTGGVFPNSDSVVKAKVADVSVTPNSNLSIGETVSNTSGSSQEYRLTVYPNFNRFGGFQSVSLDGDGTFFIANKGGNAPIVDNLDYDDLSDVPELKVLKEYDIVVSIPNNGVVSGLDFIFQSSNADVASTINMSNITGLNTSLDGKVDKTSIADNLTTDDATKVLSAKQGKILNGKVDAINSSDTSSIDILQYGPKINSSMSGVYGFVRNGWAFLYFSCRVKDGETASGSTPLFSLNSPRIIRYESGLDFPLADLKHYIKVADSTDGYTIVILNGDSVSGGNTINGNVIFPIADYGEE